MGPPWATGASPMEFRVYQPVASGPFTKAVFDTLLIVNRFFSDEYGAGLRHRRRVAAVLHHPSIPVCITILWVWGDGSSRPALSAVRPARIWIRALVALPYTITLSGTTSHAERRHGIQVHSNFRAPLATINRTGQPLRFTYTVRPRLAATAINRFLPTGPTTWPWDGHRRKQSRLHLGPGIPASDRPTS